MERRMDGQTDRKELRWKEIQVEKADRQKGGQVEEEIEKIDRQRVNKWKGRQIERH